eukprot:UC1_evm2s1355
MGRYCCTYGLLWTALLIITTMATAREEADPCAQYHGKEHKPGDGVCCCLDCGSYCGGTKSSHCDDGPGGGNDCCASHITLANNTCSSNHPAPCMLPSAPAPPLPPSPPSPLPPASGAYMDEFITRNTSLWYWSNGELGTVGSGLVWYLQNHSAVGTNLSLGEGVGMRVVCNNEPCAADPAAFCHGATMASDHVETPYNLGNGDFTLRFRAPYLISNGAAAAPDDIYAYFTAGYRRDNGKWNEMNFGFRNDARGHGKDSHTVSCEYHGDEGGYHELYADLGFNFRSAFHTYTIERRPNSLTWKVDGRTVCQAKTRLSLAMRVSLILRTNSKKSLAGVAAEYSRFSFTPK